VLGGYRERLDDEPVLVVPYFQDVEHNQRELAEKGAVLGATVLRFGRLFDLIARRTGYGASIATPLQRELIVEEAVRSAGLEVMAASAERPGFARAAARFVGELGGAMVDPPRFTQALRAWSAEGGRGKYAEEVARIYLRYHAALEAARLVDVPLYRRRALDALRGNPAAWGTTPVYFYGFDDFNRLELDAIETLSTYAGADVVISLPYEPGHPAFRSVASTYEDLRALADRHVELEAVSDHYAEESRDALHGLERGLFRPAGAPLEPAQAVALHSAAGERAEVELVAAAVLEQVRAGTAAGDIAVVFRDPGRYGSLVEQVFDAYGIPFSVDRSVRFGHTPLGRGLLALLRAAGPEGSADDLLTWLRTAGKLERPELADRLEFDVRQEGAVTAKRARAVWEQSRWPLDEVDRVRDAGSTADLLDVLASELERLFTAPYRRRAHILEGAEVDDAAAFRVGREALRGMRKLAESGAAGELPAARLHELLGRLRVHLGQRPQPDRVQVSRPEELRARRFEAVFVCGLQEGEFPRAGRPDPFLSDDERRQIAAATGLRLPVREDELERDRYLFYVCCSRAERLLVLSSRVADEEGGPQLPSFLVDDVRDLFADLPERRRGLSDVTWPLEEAPTLVEWRRAAALAGPVVPDRRPEELTHDAVLADLRAQEAFSAGALEAFADCPVKWLVDKLLDPAALEPDPEHMVRGSYAHAVLELTYRRLHDETGSRRVTPDNLEDAERILLESLRECRTKFKLSPKETRVRAAARRLEFDLLRYIRHEAQSDGRFEPAELELGFGLRNGDGEPGVEVAGVHLRGKIDRVDTWGEFALVRDYKSGKTVFPVADWEKKNRLQVAIYMLAVERLRNLKPAGGVYVPLGGKERRPRGLVRADLDEALGSGFFDNDRKDPEEFEEHLRHVEQTVAGLVERLRSGEMRACPDSCSWRGGCSYPSICREEA
jgi:ATP-dependent helicase/DNAse subunit B